MSVQKTTREGRTRYIVRWREGAAQRSRTFPTVADARAFDRELGRLRAAGELAVELGRRRVTVADLVATWITRRASAVTEQTADDYGRHFEQRILPRLGTRQASSLTPGMVEEWIAGMRERGDQDPTILKACTALQAVLTIGVMDGVLPANPVATARKPRQTRTRTPHVVTVEQVEALRAWMLQQGRERDATMVELLAYAGLRPESEACALPWRHVRPGSLLVRDTKEGRERSVPLLGPLRETLGAWRVRCGRPPAAALVVPPRAGDTWTRDEWRYWRRHRFAPAAKATGLPADVRPRDLRGSLASLLIHEGRSIVEVAAWMGHSPEVCLRDYAQIVNDRSPDARVPAEQAIWDAREAAESEVRATTVPRGQSTGEESHAA